MVGSDFSESNMFQNAATAAGQPEACVLRGSLIFGKRGVPVPRRAETGIGGPRGRRGRDFVVWVACYQYPGYSR